MSETYVCHRNDLKPGGRKIIDLGGREVGVFNLRGRYYALRNQCPHQGAPLCLGETGATMMPSPPGEYIVGREGEILRCPWHAWEFDLTTGRSLLNPTIRVKTFQVVVRDESVFVVH